MRGPVILLGALVALALAAPLLPLADPAVTELGARLRPPLAEGHPLGTDQLGRDLLSRVVHATRLSLGVALCGVAVAAVLGGVLGIVAAYYGRFVDGFVMRGVDVLMAFPYLLLALAIVAALGPGLVNATLAIAIVNVPFFARSMRGAALVIREHDYVAAARAAGASNLRILSRHVLPNLAPVSIVAASSTLGWMIVETAGLSFLGLGAQPPSADLGSLLGRARHVLGTAPHVVLVPGSVIFALVLIVNLAGDRMRDRLDPKLRAGSGEERKMR